MAASVGGVISIDPIEYGTYAIDIKAPTYAPIRIMPHQFDANERRRAVEVTLVPAIKTRISVTSQGGPAAGAWVRWAPDYSQGGHVATEGWWVRTDSRGEVSVDLPAARRVEITAEHGNEIRSVEFNASVERLSAVVSVD